MKFGCHFKKVMISFCSFLLMYGQFPEYLAENHIINIVEVSGGEVKTGEAR